MAGHSSSGFFLKDFSQKVLGIIKMFSGKNETGLNVLFAQQWFLSWNSAMQAIFAQSLSYGGVMNTDLN